MATATKRLGRVVGRGIKSIEKTAGDGTPGSVDTYTITYDDIPATTSTFQVANGTVVKLGKVTVTNDHRSLKEPFIDVEVTDGDKPDTQDLHMYMYGFKGEKGDKGEDADETIEIAEEAARAAQEAADRAQSIESEISETNKTVNEDEAARKEAEEGRVAAEKQRVANEKERADAETQRKADESLRSIEHARNNAQQEQNNADQAKNNADQAQNNREAMGIEFQILQEGEYDPDTRCPTIEGKIGKLYLTPSSAVEESDIYFEWIWIKEYQYERVGKTAVALDPMTTDQIDAIVGGAELKGKGILDEPGLSYYDKKRQELNDSLYTKQVDLDLSLYTKTASSLTYLGLNPISSIDEDTQSKWMEIGPGYAYFNQQLVNGQPSDFGFLINFNAILGNDIFQMWMSMLDGKTFTRVADHDTTNMSRWIETNRLSEFIEIANQEIDALIEEMGIIGPITQADINKLFI